MKKRQKIKPENIQIRVSEVLEILNKVQENLKNGELNLSHTGSLISLLRNRAEEAETELGNSKIAQEILANLLKNSQETINNCEIAISVLKATIKEKNVKIADKNRALKSLKNIAQQNINNFKATAVALSTVTQLAYNDSLTGLPNRRLLSDRLKRCIIENKRTNSYSAVLFFDLDKFKLLNDKYGHEAGDNLLIAISSRLLKSIRESDTVARYGGDEFVILLTNLFGNLMDARIEAESVANKILNSLSRPFPIYVHENGNKKKIEFVIHASIGVAMFSGDSSIESSVIDWADEAMYLAKSDGGNLVRFYDAINTTEDTLLALYDLAKTYTQDSNHGIRIKQYVKTLANRALQMELYPNQLTNQVIERMFKTAQLYDIGKTEIPYVILHKKSKLTDAEWIVMKTYPTLGVKILIDAQKLNSNLESALNTAIEMSATHHEHWDGSGYPKGLLGEEIPLAGRVVAIADVYDALTSKQGRKENMSHEEVCKEIISRSGAQFDPMLIEAFICEMESFKLIAENNKI